MNVAESKRVRHLVLHVERGEELPVALIRALHDVEARAAIIHGVGIAEAIEIATIDQQGRSTIHRLDTPTVVVSLKGNVAVEDGATNVHLYATLARQTELGHQTISGHVRWARASALDLHVTVFDDLVLERLTDDFGFSAALHASSRVAGTPAKIVVEEAPREVVAVTPVVISRARIKDPEAKAAVKEPEAKPVIKEPEAKPVVKEPEAKPVVKEPEAKPVVKEPEAKPFVREPDVELKPGPALSPPARLNKPEEDEAYPEVGDLVTHFHFGECEVIGSDGERIRLRQIKDGRVREVALAMLKIENPSIDAATNKRLFHLSRKN